MRQVLFDFGKVSVDTIQKEIVKIVSKSTEDKIYHVIYLCTTNAIDRAFQVAPCTQELSVGNDYELEITFSPKLPHYYVDYIAIQDESNMIEFVITVKGVSIGPAVKLSQHFVSFVAANNKDGERMKCIELVNDSTTGTSFQWYLSKCLQGDFQIQSGDCGFIQGRERVKVEIAFTGELPLVSSAELVCLLHHQAPLFLKVTGTCSTIETPLPPPVTKVKKPYVRLMKNSLKCYKRMKQLSVHDSFLDFGTGDVEDVTMNISQTLNVTNHSEQDAVFEWLQDPDHVFIIKPKIANLKPRTSEIFGIRFRPKEENYCYSHLLTGVCKFASGDPEVENFKEVWFRIPSVGNTWKCEGWSTEYSIPTEVIMPPTVPGVTAYTNFVLSNVGEKPIYFIFRGPDENNFTLLPMVGMVGGRGWQIITVAMEGRNEGYYSECWEVELNCCKKVRIQLSGSAENALIQIKAGSIPTTRPMFGFDPTVTHTVSGVLTHIHNMSRNYVHVNMFSSPDWLGGDAAGAITMYPNEVVPYHWWFRPEVANQFYETTVTCSSLPILNGRKAIIEPTETSINISGYSENPNIQVTPKTYNLENINVGEVNNFTLTLYNMGVCNVLILLNYELTSMCDAGVNDDQIEFEPRMMSIDQSESHSVQVKVVSTSVGDRQVDVVFSILFYSEFDQLISIQPEQRILCTFWYDTVIPTIQVKRVVANDCAGIFSNDRLWKMLNIDMFNEALLNASPNKPVIVNMCVPDSYLYASDIEIILIIDSMYSSVDWSLQRLQLCDCKMVEVQTGISLKKMVHSCSCRDLLELSPLEHTTSLENASELLMTIRYSLEGTNVLAYTMILSHKRRIDIHVTVHVNPTTAKMLAPLSNLNGDCSKNTVKLDCGRVTISNLDPVIKVLWLYNSTCSEATWQLINGNENSLSAIYCLTVACEVMPQCHLAVLFSFIPSEMIEYKQEFSAMMGDSLTIIEVTGQGSLPYSAPLTSGAPKCMEKRIKSAKRKDTIYVSTEYITLPPMLTHSTVTRMFSITNSSDFVLSYVWLKEHIEGVLMTSVTPVRGIMAAHSTYWMTLTVHTLQSPASLLFVIVCETLNLTMRRAYERQESAQQLMSEKKQSEYMSDDELENGSSNDNGCHCLSDAGLLKAPTCKYISLSVDLSSISAADNSHMMLRELQQQQPPYDLSTETNSENLFDSGDHLQLLDCVLWKMIHNHHFKQKYKTSSQRELPSYKDMINDETQLPTKLLSKRFVSAICTSIISKSIHDIFTLYPQGKTGGETNTGFD